MLPGDIKEAENFSNVMIILGNDNSDFNVTFVNYFLAALVGSQLYFSKILVNIFLFKTLSAEFVYDNDSSRKD